MQDTNIDFKMEDNDARNERQTGKANPNITTFRPRSLVFSIGDSDPVRPLSILAAVYLHVSAVTFICAWQMRLRETSDRWSNAFVVCVNLMK